jgi:putative addiction module component (TIGR02574 family)
MDIDIAKLLALPPAERAKLARLLWDSIPDNADLSTLPISEAEQAELERRLDEYEAEGEPADGRAVDAVIAEVRRRL